MTTKAWKVTQHAKMGSFNIDLRLASINIEVLRSNFSWLSICLNCHIYACT